MKFSIRLLSSIFIISAALCFQSVSGKNLISRHNKQQGNRTDTLSAVHTMRVVFLPGSTAKNFRIGIETVKKCDVNIQVIDKQGMVVYSDVVEKVSKKVEERDFSWLKSGEYTIKVMNSDSEFVKTLVI
jgi:hypothetical protein